MKAEDMPTPETDAAKYDVEYETSSDYTDAAWRLASSLEQRLAAQTATAQSLRATVERAVEVLEKIADETAATWVSDRINAFLAEIGARSAEAIQERKARRDNE